MNKYYIRNWCIYCKFCDVDHLNDTWWCTNQKHQGKIDTMRKAESCKEFKDKLES